jgi:very-short-patch-repair endonuclease
MKENPSFLETRAAEYLSELGIPCLTQQAVGWNYILDFVGEDRLFVLEVDGKHHEEPRQAAKDRKRDYLMTRAGFKVIRLRYQDVTLARLRMELQDVVVTTKLDVRKHLWLARELVKYNSAKW